MRARLRIAMEREALLAEKMKATERQEPAAEGKKEERQEPAVEGKKEEEEDRDTLPQMRARSASPSMDWSPSAASASSAIDLDLPQPAGDAARGRHLSQDQERTELNAGVSAPSGSSAKPAVLAKNDAGEAGCGEEAGLGGGDEKPANPLDEFFSQRPAASSTADARSQTAFTSKPPRDGSKSPAQRRAFESDVERRDARDARRRSRSLSRSGRPLTRRATYPPSPVRQGQERRLTRSEDRGDRSRDLGGSRSLQAAGRRSPDTRRSAEDRPGGEAGECARGSRGDQVDAFCKEHGVGDKARIIMYNMHPDDLQIVFKEAYRLAYQANNPTGFIITRIRNIEQRAGRPWGGKSGERAASDRHVDRPRDSRDCGAPPRSSTRNPQRDASVEAGPGGRDRERIREEDRQTARGGFRSRDPSRGRGRGQEEPFSRRRSRSRRR